jgi:hypothetical protein
MTSADYDNQSSDHDHKSVDSQDIAEVLKELRQIRIHLAALLESPIARHASKRRLFAIHFFKGVFLGVGSFFGATIVVSLLIYILSHVQFVPFMGDIVKQILLEVQK